jgi:hypothetical protein
MPKELKTIDLINSIVSMKVEKGASNKTILDFLQNDLEYGQTYAYEILREARKKIQEIWDKNAEAHLEESKGQLEELYEDAIRNKNGKLALEIRKEMNRLMGLYAAEKIELSGELKAININIIKTDNTDES